RHTGTGIKDSDLDPGHYLSPDRTGREDQDQCRQQRDSSQQGVDREWDWHVALRDQVGFPESVSGNAPMISDGCYGELTTG
ncbi:MAG: hypothetical protein AAB075_03020, partial [Gemmatimonadota bacterium]